MSAYPTQPDVPRSFTLLDLPFAARITLAVFLVSVGIGYFSALVNLHFQEASPGEILPTDEDVKTSYSGKSKVSQMERLLVAHPSLPINGQGSMRKYLTGNGAGGWEGAKRALAKKKGIDLTANPPRQVVKEIEEAVQHDLDGERFAMIAWTRSPRPERKKTYGDNASPLKGEFALSKDNKVDLAKMNITAKFVDDDGAGNRTAQIKTIFDTRCARCHSESAGGPAARFPLDDFEQIDAYCVAEAPTGKSLPKLALSTHVHLLGFSVLYGFTGLIFAVSGWPAPIRVLIAPLALAAQVVDISFWWLARIDEPHGPMFASFIPISGGVVAVALGLQILLGLFALFRSFGKVVLVVLIAAAIGGAVNLKTAFLDPYLARERGNPGEMVQPKEPAKAPDDAKK
jgi:hypothetical protein